MNNNTTVLYGRIIERNNQVICFQDVDGRKDFFPLSYVHKIHEVREDRHSIEVPTEFAIRRGFEKERRYGS